MNHQTVAAWCGRAKARRRNPQYAVDIAALLGNRVPEMLTNKSLKMESSVFGWQ